MKCTCSTTYATDDGARICVLCHATVFPAPPRVGKTPGTSWTALADGTWAWRYPRRDVAIIGTVLPDGSWRVSADFVVQMASRRAAPTLKTAGRQCWRAMLRVSTWHAPREWRLALALARLGCTLVQMRRAAMAAAWDSRVAADAAQAEEKAAWEARMVAAWKEALEEEARGRARAHERAAVQRAALDAAWAALAATDVARKVNP